MSKSSEPVKKGVTVEGYVVKKGAENLYHVEVEIYTWKQMPGGTPPVKTSNPHVVKFHEADFRRFLEDLPRTGYTINSIKHDPDPVQTEKIKSEVEQARANKQRLSK